MITSKNPASVSVPREGSARLYVDPCCNAEAGDLIMGNQRISYHKHGLTGTKLYSVWVRIKNRCLNPNANDYKFYGGRGIKLHPEWITDAKSFVDYVKQLPNYFPSMSLDRINTHGNYEPGNLRWVTQSVQAKNKRKQHNNTTGYTGVRLLKANGKFEAKIIIDYRFKYIGIYNSPKEAAIARDQYIIDNELWDYPLQILNKPKID